MAKPVAVDVSSGVETDHVKNAAKVRQFVAAVRETCAEKGETDAESEKLMQSQNNLRSKENQKSEVR